MRDLINHAVSVARFGRVSATASRVRQKLQSASPFLCGLCLLCVLKIREDDGARVHSSQSILEVFSVSLYY